MQLGLTGLQKSDAALKHLIVISDGDPSPPTPALVQQFVDAKISVSMIAINPHGGQDISIMQSIAQQTGGRYYFPQDPIAAARHFHQGSEDAEALDAAKQSLHARGRVSVAGAERHRRAAAAARLRAHHGEAARQPRSCACRPTTEEPGGELDPLLATWRFGLGTTAAWTSDLGAVVGAGLDRLGKISARS